MLRARALQASASCVTAEPHRTPRAPTPAQRSARSVFRPRRPDRPRRPNAGRLPERDHGEASACAYAGPTHIRLFRPPPRPPHAGPAFASGGRAAYPYTRTRGSRRNALNRRCGKGGVESEEHQRLVNALAKALEQKKGVDITHVDVGSTPRLFDEKYRRLPEPLARSGKIPDLQGTDQRGVIHLGEAKTDVSGPYTEHAKEQICAFGCRVMRDTDVSVPLHVIVPRGGRDAMERFIHRIGLGDKIDKHIHVWEGSA